MISQEEILTYYSQPGMYTDLRDHAAIRGFVPAHIPALCAMIQGLLIHVFWLERMGVDLPDERMKEVDIRSAAGMMERILELDSRDLDMARKPEQRLVGNCRDFSTMMAAFLRLSGVPARARCGFGTYFLPDHYEDHWVCEMWDAGEKRWKLVDSQLDALQRHTLNISFSPFDVPRDQFVTAGIGWKMCREGKADPDSFGILEYYGLWFVRGNVIRDFLAMNRIELLPWDSYGLIAKKDEELTEEDLVKLDTIAALTNAGDGSFDELCSLYENDATLSFSEDLLIKEE